MQSESKWEIERADAGPRAETDGLFRSDGRPVQQFPEVPRRSDDRGINNADNLPDRIDRLYERRSEPTPQGIGHPQSERGYDEGYSTDILEDVLRIALPAILLGCGISYFVAEHWQRQFVEKIPLSAWIFLAGALFVCLVVLICIVYRIWDVANEDPVDSLKSE